MPGSNFEYKDLDKGANMNRPYDPSFALVAALDNAANFMLADPPMKGATRNSVFGPLADIGAAPLPASLPIALKIENGKVVARDATLQTKIENESYKLVRVDNSGELPHRFTKCVAVPYTFELPSENGNGTTTVTANLFVLWSGNGEV